MYLIGEFANIVRVSRKTLKHYEKLNLVVPQEINKNTGYRYYSDEQIQGVLRILELRRLGFTLKEIREILDEYNTVKLRTALAKRQGDLEDKISQLRFLKNAVERKIEKLKLDESACKSAPKPQVLVKVFGQMTAYSQRELINLDEIDDFIERFYHQMKALDLEPYGPLMVRFYHEDELLIGVADTELFSGVASSDEIVGINGNIKSIEQFTYASATFESEESDVRYDAMIDEIYDFLLLWIQENHYKINGIPFEIFLQKSMKSDIHGISRFEICYPIELYQTE